MLIPQHNSSCYKIYRNKRENNDQLIAEPRDHVEKQWNLERRNRRLMCCIQPLEMILLDWKIFRKNKTLILYFREIELVLAN